jgi:hypothetical protein
MKLVSHKKAEEVLTANILDAIRAEILSAEELFWSHEATYPTCKIYIPREKLMHDYFVSSLTMLLSSRLSIMLKYLILSFFLFSHVATDDEVINDDDPNDEVVTDEEIAEDNDEKTPPSGKPEGKENVISYSQPSLSEEEQKSHHFPARYRCEACQIVVHNVSYYVYT